MAAVVKPPPVRATLGVVKPKPGSTTVKLVMTPAEMVAVAVAAVVGVTVLVMLTVGAVV